MFDAFRPLFARLAAAAVAALVTVLAQRFGVVVGDDDAAALTHGLEVFLALAAYAVTRWIGAHHQAQRAAARAVDAHAVQANADQEAFDARP